MPDDVTPITTLDDLTPDARNANRGTERGNGLIEKSLERYGAGRSILVDRHGNVVAGNKTLSAWVGIGTERVRVVQTDGHELVVVQRTDLDLDSKAGRELAIADNRTADLNLAWDAPELASLAADYGLDLPDLGFTEGELAELQEQTRIEGDESPAAPREVTCPHCGGVFTPTKGKPGAQG